MQSFNFRIYTKNNDSLEFCNLEVSDIPHLHLITKRSEIINIGKRSMRAGVIHSGNHIIYIISKNQNHLKSSSKFQNETDHLQYLPEQLESIKTQQKAFQTERIQRLAHNIRSINAKCLQSFYSVFSQEAISYNETAIVDVMNKKMLDNPNPV